MSGFEVAGIVLRAIPLVVKALEAYSSFLADWGKTPSELKSLNRQLTTERSKFVKVTRDGQVEWMNWGRMTHEFKKFLHRSNRKDY
ncbi:hypothetical protein HRG_010537 [Hirsutella rhossiliensis]|uniref:Uncharacterized protein n=1 Tax=Hirsutella rhossiliensis TaxID=111463 RepID=A0A9P8SEP0_9HYPO|nr:uncharacterized protein HRG_10537 [Hirsutella rhossiliensis]KAH0958236.1 hypothetical protein HRG_10537 [Hirsutella rhossiliensis]